MKRIAIFGANGNLGRQAVLAFRDAGWNVRAVTREGKYEHASGIEVVAADALDRQQAIDASQGCDFIFNSLNPIYPKWKTQCLPMARNIMAAAKENNAVHLFPGNVYNFGTAIPAVVDENTQFSPDHHKAQIRVDMEALFERHATKYGVQTIIVRAGDFFGGTRTGASWFDFAISKKLGKGKMIYPGPMDVVHSWVYLPDAAQVFVKLAKKAGELPKFDVFNIEGFAVTGDELKHALEAVTGKKLKSEGIPWALLRVIGIFSPMLKQVCQMSYQWTTPHRLDQSKLERLIGEVSHTAHETALSQALVDLGMGELVHNASLPRDLATAI